MLLPARPGPAQSHPACHINSVESSRVVLVIQRPVIGTRHSHRNVVFFSDRPTDRPTDRLTDRQTCGLVFINTYQVCWSTASLTTSLRRVLMHQPCSLHRQILFSRSPTRHSRRRRGNFRSVTCTNSTSAEQIILGLCHRTRRPGPSASAYRSWHVSARCSEQ